MKQVISLLCLIVFSFSVKAADLIVEEFGTAPTYGSIAAAVTAATNGDRIIIKNRAGDVPWIENITINKSLTFLSYTNNTQFIVQGTYTLDYATGREINIIGMKNTSGNINVGTGSATLRSTKVSIMDCWLVSGGISLANQAIDAQIVGNLLNSGSVSIQYGNVIGNDITSGTDSITITPLAVYQNDTCNIVGNKLFCNSGGDEALRIVSSSQTYHIRNNFIKHSGYGISVSGMNGSAAPHLIWNNTIINQLYNSSNFAIYIVSASSPSVIEIMNNVLDESAPGTSYGIYNNGSGQVNVYYNWVDSSFDSELPTGYTFSGNNTINQTFTLNADGSLPAGNPAINGGNPAQPYYDLDLSIGDPGAYGGSYTLSNFFPLFSGAARVYFVKFPFNVRQGSTLSIKAFGYDR